MSSSYAQAVAAPSRAWQPVCRRDELQAERGVAALIGGIQVALYAAHDGRLYAIGNRDPFSGAFVLSRGIVGSRGAKTTVSSPMHKQVFDLSTGVCLDDESVSVPVFGVRVRDGVVEVTVE